MEDLLESIAHHMAWHKHQIDCSLYTENGELEEELFAEAMYSIRKHWQEHLFNYGLPEELKVEELDKITIDDIDLNEVF